MAFSPKPTETVIFKARNTTLYESEAIGKENGLALLVRETLTLLDLENLQELSRSLDEWLEKPNG